MYLSDSSNWERKKLKRLLRPAQLSVVRSRFHNVAIFAAFRLKSSYCVSSFELKTANWEIKSWVRARLCE